MPQPEQLSPRLQAIKDAMLQLIPVKKATDGDELASKPLTDAVIFYLSWRARLIRPRPRTVVVWPEVISCPHYATYRNAIETIKSELERGDNMNPRLSNQVRTNAYSSDLPTKPADVSNEEWTKKRWKGKDKVRVTVDTHHLHLGERKADGTVGRTGELLFAGIAADAAFLLMIGDHNSFDDGAVSILMYEKLDAKLASEGGGITVSGPGVTLGGTQIGDTLRAIEIVKQLRAFDNELDSKGHTVSDRSLKLDWDDVVVVDSNGMEVVRKVGLL